MLDNNNDVYANDKTCKCIVFSVFYSSFSSDLAISEKLIWNRKKEILPFFSAICFFIQIKIFHHLKK